MAGNGRDLSYQLKEITTLLSFKHMYWYTMGFWGIDSIVGPFLFYETHKPLLLLLILSKKMLFVFLADRFMILRQLLKMN